MDEMFQRFIDNGFSEFAGLTVDASVPITEEIVNEFVALRLRGDPNIRECLMSIRLHNQVVVHLVTPLWFLPVKVKLALEKFVDLNGSPKIKARMENNILLGKLGSLLNMLPEGISLNGDRVVVDIDSFVTDPQYKKLYRLLKSVELHTEKGKVFCDVKIGVGENIDPDHLLK